jgi:hypothetical protein
LGVVKGPQTFTLDVIALLDMSFHAYLLNGHSTQLKEDQQAARDTSDER